MFIEAFRPLEGTADTSTDEKEEECKYQLTKRNLKMYFKENNTPREKNSSGAVDNRTGDHGGALVI